MADQTDPDQIQHEIERTRAELAETIDAIAEKVSPKRAVARTAGRVRVAVRGDTRPRLEAGVPETGERVPLVADGRPAGVGATAIDQHELHAAATGEPSGTATSPVYTVRRTLRVDRVLIVGGVVAAVAAVVVLVRRRRRGG